MLLRCCEWVGWGFDVVFKADTPVLRGGEGVVGFEEWECGCDVAKEEQLGVLGIAQEKRLDEEEEAKHEASKPLRLAFPFPWQPDLVLWQ